MDSLFMGILVAASVIVIIYKIEQRMYESAILDGILSFGLMAIFSGSYIGLSVSIVAGLVVSAYLYYFKPKFYERVKTYVLKHINKIQEK